MFGLSCMNPSFCIKAPGFVILANTISTSIQDHFGLPFILEAPSNVVTLVTMCTCHQTKTQTSPTLVMK